MIDKELLTSCFTKSQNISWPCSTCSNGYLVINEDTFFSKETSVSLKGHSHYEWEPEWVSFVYSCILDVQITIVMNSLQAQVMVVWIGI